ncbi:hypothetical protein [Streptomyces sp. NPDC090021]|uniref:hypothetical protein n=1 Tax=Streptomyces sp. NPDC090021 TaxID=3365919 RepID=UPI00382A07F7
MTTHLPTCARCGDALADQGRVDFGFDLPEAAHGAPEEALHRLGVRGLLRDNGTRAAGPPTSGGRRGGRSGAGTRAAAPASGPSAGCP